MTVAVSSWLLLKVFASGCTALTGVEAVSNGVKAFGTYGQECSAQPHRDYFSAGGDAGGDFLSGEAYGIAATDPGQPGYQSVLSMLTAAVFGKGFFYYLTMGSILVVLRSPPIWPLPIFRVSAAPSRRIITCRMCLGIAGGGWFTPTASWFWRCFAAAFSFFSGVTDRLIPLYAVGAFLAFTLSQAGMVMHWGKNRGPHGGRARS